MHAITKRHTALVRLAVVVCTILPATSASAKPKQCVETELEDPAEITATIRAFFAALSVDDVAAVKRLTTPDFYAFEVGKRFTGSELSKLIADAHRAGRIMQWNIGPPDIRADCNIAFAAWENTGAVGTNSKLEARAWLESALLTRQGNRWVIRFLHSTPKDPRP